MRITAMRNLFVSRQEYRTRIPQVPLLLSTFGRRVQVGQDNDQFLLSQDSVGVLKTRADGTTYIADREQMEYFLGTLFQQPLFEIHYIEGMLFDGPWYDDLEQTRQLYDKLFAMPNVGTERREVNERRSYGYDRGCYPIDLMNREQRHHNEVSPTRWAGNLNPYTSYEHKTVRRRFEMQF